LRKGKLMVLQHQVGYKTVIPEIPVSRGVLGKVMRTGQPVLLIDVHTDPDFLEAMPGITSEACVPLFDGSRPVGALNIETQGVELTDADLRLLAALGEQIGLALGRARLYTQVRDDAATEATLLHEVNHRVKNNLSSIIGLLQLEQDYVPALREGPQQDLIGDLIGRIQSLAAVHDLLSEVRWAPLPIHDLANRIVRAAIAVAPPHSELAVDIPPSPVQVTAKQASALALIINELATNSLKHALSNASALRIAIQFQQEAKQIMLEYRDNGPGFPSEVLCGERENVGLHLVRMLSRHDLRGKIDLSNRGGAVVRISFGTSAEGNSGTGPLDLPLIPGLVP
jgi:two-component sensor histidine kinase